MARLGDVVTIQASSKHLCGERFWLLNLDMVEQQTGKVIDYNYVLPDKLNGSIVQFDSTVVLYSKLRPNLNKVVLPQMDGYATSEMLPLKPDNKKLVREYLAEYLRSDGFVMWAVSKTAGAKMPRLGTKELLNADIPLPPVEEQQHIAQLFAQTNSLISLRKQQLAKLDELVKGRFVELFGEQRHPNMPLIKLIMEGAGLSYGIIVPGDNVEYGVPMIRPSDFKNDNLRLDNVYRVAPEIEAKYARTRLIGDEILVQVIGQPGQIMLSDDRCVGMNVTRNLAVVRSDHNRINRIYLKTYMQTQEAQAFMLGETKQSTLKQLPLSRLKELEIPVPPMVVQNQFAAFVEQTDKSKLAIQQSLDKLETLKKSLMQKYFG